MTRRQHLASGGVVVVIVVLAALVLGLVTRYNYDGSSIDASSEEPLQIWAAEDLVDSPRAADRLKDGSGYDHRANLARASVRPGGYRLAPSTAAARPRFAVDSRGAATELRPGGVVEVERIAPSALKPNDAVGAWDDFLGPGPHSNIHPRTGLADPNRLVSADGTRSIRYGAQEMGGRPTRHHFHQESWAYDQGLDVWWVDNLLVRVPLR